MASQVYFHFKSQQGERSTISFDGTGISVWELKKEIWASNNYGKAADHDFQIIDPDTEQEYRNDEEIIPRASTVIARRAPARNPGRGTALKYVVIEGAGPTSFGGGGFQGGSMTWRRGEMSRRFDQPEPEPQPVTENIVPSNATASEQDALAAWKQAEKAVWEKEETKMTQHKRYMAPSRGGFAGGSRGGFAAAPSRPVPPGYKCHKCMQPGHWIQECPTLDDPNIDPKQRFKRMAGVPRSQLEVVGEDAAADGKDIMVLQDGTRVRQIADKSAWERQAIRLPTTADDVHKSQPTDPDLTCPICSKLLKEAVVVPCCSTAFCDECIRSYLVKHANACYECETRLKSVAVLKVDEDRRRRVAEYVQEMVRVGKEAAKVEGAEAGSRASSAVPGGEVKDELSETASNGPTIDPNRSIGARPPPKPLTILQQSQLAQAENLVKIMLLLASPNLTPQHRTQLQGQLASMQHLVSGVKGVYRPGVAPPNLLPARMPGVPPHSMMPHQPPGVPTGPRGNAFGLGAGRGRGGFGIPQQQWGYHQQQPFQQQQQNGFGYNNGVRDLSAFREGSGIKRERPPDFVTLGGPSEKMYRAE